MPVFELVRATDAGFPRATSITRTLYVPDVDGNWRELRLGAAPATPASRPEPRRASPGDLLVVRHAA